MSYETDSPDVILSKFWQCPNCSGLGHMMDGSFILHGDGTSEVTPSTKCSVCRGKKVVLVIPVPEDQLTA